MVQRIVCSDAAERIRSAEYIDILCVGTPKVIGDSIGPTVGSLLKKNKLPSNINIVGCLQDPVHAKNIESKVSDLRDGAFVICVDAAINKEVPTVALINKPLRPGSGVGKDLGEFGDVTVLCRVCNQAHELHTCDPLSVNILAANATALIVTLLESD